MLKIGLFTGLLTAAAAAVAQPAGGAPPAIQQAAMAFGQCIDAGIRGVAATVTPEAGATGVLAGCAAQKAALENTVESFIAGAPMPEEQKTAARTQLRTELARAEVQIAQMIRQGRSAPAQPAQ